MRQFVVPTPHPVNYTPNTALTSVAFLLLGVFLSWKSLLSSDSLRTVSPGKDGYDSSAMAEMVLSEPVHAISMLEEIQRAEGEAGEYLRQSQTLLLLARAYHQCSKSRQSKLAIAQARQTLKEVSASDERDSLNVLLTLSGARSALKEREIEEATELLNEAVEGMSRVDDTYLKPHYFYVMGLAAHYTGDYNRAAQILTDCLRDHRPFMETDLIARAHNNIGAAYSRYTEPDSAQFYEAKSMEHYREAVQYYKESKNKYGLGIVLCNIAIHYMDGGQVDTAMALYAQSCELMRAVPNPAGLAFTMTNQAISIRDLGQKEEALVMMDSAEHFARVGRDPALLARILTEQSELQANLNRYDRAYEKLLQASSLRDSLGLNALDVTMERTNTEFLLERADTKAQGMEQMLKLRAVAQRTERLALVAVIIFLLSLAALIYFILQNRLLQKARSVSNLRYKMLMSELNPHFVFNALNSIQNFVLHGDKMDSYSYISKFSKLVRYSLRHHSDDYATLESELDNVRSYITLELLRASQPVDLEVHVDEDINPAEVNIPAMVLQILVENALWHGLAPKKDKGKLWILSQRSGSLLRLIVADNGIGMVASERLKAQERPDHQSRGLDLVKSKIELLNRGRSGKLKLTIRDGVFHSAKEASGTTAILHIPLNA